MIATLSPKSFRKRSHDAHRLHRATQPLANLLKQLGEVVTALTDAQYTQKPVGVVESSVGGHVRHCLDHVRALLSAIDTGSLDYDTRQRGTPVESSRCCAISEIDELTARLAALPARVIDKSLAMSVMMSSDGDPVEVQSTVGRELAFTLNHTLHHNALIAAMVKMLGGWLPEKFGYAPSTVKHLNGNTACAR